MSRARQVFGPDGLWTGKTLDVPESDLAANVPDGCTAVDAVAFPHAVRLLGGVLEDFQPDSPDPAADHEWDDREKRWRRTSQSLRRDADKRAAQERIDELERQQARAIREERLGRGGTPAQLSKRLEDIDDQIITLRAIINS